MLRMLLYYHCIRPATCCNRVKPFYNAASLFSKLFFTNASVHSHNGEVVANMCQSKQFLSCSSVLTKSDLTDSPLSIDR
jgi:hypothetical protein